MRRLADLKKLDIAARVEGSIKTLRDYAHKEAERGVKIPGYKLVMKRGTRVYTDPQAAERKLVRKLKTAGAYEKKLISPAQAENKLGKAIKRLRFVLHPDKLPKDLNEEQAFLCKMVWDIVSDGMEEYEKHKDDLDWLNPSS